jgi:hypothetical protein
LLLEAIIIAFQTGLVLNIENFMLVTDLKECFRKKYRLEKSVVLGKGCDFLEIVFG